MPEPTKYTVYFTNDFKRAQRKIRHQKRLFEKLQKVVAMLTNGEPLPAKNRDHPLTNSKKYQNAANAMSPQTSYWSIKKTKTY